ncbi:hypothetical protein A5697_19185 [Mycobacterium sp. E3251]|nr:hypothetical protein A5697_19185 [Mycobacterium sp. E3251]
MVHLPGGRSAAATAYLFQRSVFAIYVIDGDTIFFVGGDTPKCIRSAVCRRKCPGGVAMVGVERRI